MLRLSERQESEIHALGLGLLSSNARLSLSGENIGIPNDCYVFQHVRVVCYEARKCHFFPCLELLFYLFRIRPPQNLSGFLGFGPWGIRWHS